jgi:hypothetical protein
MAVTWARQALERELYWRTDPVAGGPLSPAEELRGRVEELAGALRRDATQAAPWGDPSLSSSTGLKRKYKIAIHRLLRPLTRRYDRISAELAATCVSLADLARRFETESDQLRQQIATLQEELRAVRSAAGSGD